MAYVGVGSLVTIHIFSAPALSEYVKYVSIVVSSVVVFHNLCRTINQCNCIERSSTSVALKVRRRNRSKVGKIL